MQGKQKGYFYATDKKLSAGSNLSQAKRLWCTNNTRMEEIAILVQDLKHKGCWVMMANKYTYFMYKV